MKSLTIKTATIFMLMLFALPLVFVSLPSVIPTVSAGGLIPTTGYIATGSSTTGIYGPHPIELQIDGIVSYANASKYLSSTAVGKQYAVYDLGIAGATWNYISVYNYFTTEHEVSSWLGFMYTASETTTFSAGTNILTSNTYAGSNCDVVDSGKTFKLWHRDLVGSAKTGRYARLGFAPLAIDLSTQTDNPCVAEVYLRYKLDPFTSAPTWSGKTIQWVDTLTPYNESSYSCTLYKNGILVATVSKTANSTSCDFTAQIATNGFGEYTAKVQKIGETTLNAPTAIGKTIDSDLSAVSSILNVYPVDDATTVANAKATLTEDIIKNSNTDLSNITSNLNLPTVFADTNISWNSTNSAISTSGVVTRPEAGSPSVVGTLTATITKGSSTDTKIFNVTILNKDIHMSVGTYIQFGNYYGDPILWRCVDIDENGPLMLADKILSLKSFDAKGVHPNDYDDNRLDWGSNLWETSNMRSWLNSTGTAGNVSWLCGVPPATGSLRLNKNPYNTEKGFLAVGNFSAIEQKAIKNITQKSILNYHDIGMAEGGTAIMKSEYNISVVVQNYDTAYYKNLTDKMFLLDILQLDKLHQNENILGANYYMAKPTAKAVANSAYTDQSLTTTKYWDYWLRTPTSFEQSPNGVRIVQSQGMILGDDAYYDYVGVRPAFYLSTPNISLVSGAGTLSSPLVVDVFDFNLPYSLSNLNFVPNAGVGSLTVDITNNTSNVKTVNIIYGVYNANKLVGIKIVQQNLIASETKSLIYPLPVFSGTQWDMIKTFSFDTDFSAVKAVAENAIFVR